MNSTLFLVAAGIAIIVLLALAKVPIWVSIFCGTVFIQTFVNHLPLQGIFVTVAEGLNKPSLMCVPFFILVGCFIQESSMSRRLIELCIIMLRRVRGGLAIACVIANALFGAISGSSAASVAMFGKIVHEPLTRSYDEQLSLGIITSSATLSSIIPPSITLIMFGVVTNTSITKLFAAGFVPGILIVAAVTVYIELRLSRKKRAGAPEETQAVENMSFGKALARAVPVLILPVGIFGGIYSGVFTPQEASAVAALYSMLCAFALGDLNIRKCWGIFISAIKTTAQIFILVGASIAFSQAITVAQVPQIVGQMLSGVSKIQFLLILNVILLIVGCFLDASCSVLIFAPIFMPTARLLGLDPVHMGIIFTVNLAIGMFTPPFGMNLFVCQSVTEAKIGVIIRSVVPYMIIYFVMTLVFTYVPQISLFLPGLMY